MINFVFSFNLWSEHTVLGKNLFELLDYLTANIMLPLGGLGIAIFAGWVMHRQDTRQELALGHAGFQVWQLLIKYLAPAAVFIVFLHVLGIL